MIQILAKVKNEILILLIMKMIDTHTHLYLEAFDADRNEVIKKAINEGVHRFYLPAIDSSYTNKMYELEKLYPEHIRLMAGLHPTHVKENYLEELNHVSENLSKRDFIAVGEIGIDLYWDKTFLKQQQESFNYQIVLAKKYDLPIVIHCRNAFDEVFDVLEDHKGSELHGVFHCFTGTYEHAKRAIDFNLKLGIGGVVTFKNGKIDQFLNKIPLENIVLETDSPYLAPVPHRGKRNESGYLTLVNQKVAEIYCMTQGQIAMITTENAISVFKNI
jgi:TatD DNase family protein